MKKVTKEIGGVVKDPPQTLILNKKYIQQLPNNQKVVIYNCPTLKKNFSLLYDNKGYQLSESDSSVFDKLKNVEEVETLYFKDGSELNINRECSQSILELYENMEEHQELEEYLMESQQNFLNLLKYSVNKFKKET